MKTKLPKISRGDNKFAYILMGPSLLLLISLIGYPMVYNVIISFQDVPLNPRMDSEFVGLENYISVLTDSSFYSSVLVTILFTAVVTIISTIFALALAIFMNRDFFGKKIVNSLLILSYVVPAVCLIFVWRYMFNNIYGIINYVLVDATHILKEAPLWFDEQSSAFVLVSIFAIWKFFPYAYMAFLAILQSIDKSLYEAARVDGASVWQQFKAVTLPAIKPVMVTVVSLRIIWVFYIYAEVYLLTKQVGVLGVYLYDMAFATNDFGKAAAISVVLFFLIFGIIMLLRRRLMQNEV